MKKFLLSAMALVAAMSVNAQVFQVNGSEKGLSSDLAPVEAGYAWGSIEGAIDISNAFATDHKVVDCKNNDFNKVVIDGAEILTKDGVQGNDNPKDADGTGVGASLKEPVSGAVIQIDAKKDGWVYIVSKLSTNKQYVVFEEGSPMGYKIAMENATEDVINIEVKGEGEYNYLDPAKFEGGLPWVIRIFKDNNEAESAGNGLGVFYFPVAEGCKYYASASGSKISWSGIYFSETEAQTITVEGEGISKTIVGGGDNPGPGEEVQETLLWEGEAVATGWANQPGLLSDGGAELTAAGAAAGDIIRFYCSAPDDNWQCELTEGHWGGMITRWAAKDLGPNEDGTAREYNIVDLSKGYIDLTLTEDMLTKATTVQYWGNVFLLNGDGGLTVTKLTLIKGNGETAIQSAKAQAQKSAIRYNLAGQKVDGNYKGIVIENGKKFMVK